MRRVFNLDAGDILLGNRVADDDIVRLAHIDTGIRRPAHRDPFDENIRALDRIDTICAVFRIGVAEPLHREIAVDDAVCPLGLYAISLGFLNGEVFEGDIV